MRGQVDLGPDSVIDDGREEEEFLLLTFTSIAFFLINFHYFLFSFFIFIFLIFPSNSRI